MYRTETFNKFVISEYILNVDNYKFKVYLTEFFRCSLTFFSVYTSQGSVVSELCLVAAEEPRDTTACRLLG